MSDIVDEKQRIVNTLAIIGYNPDGDLRCHAPGLDPGKLVFILEKVKISIIASVEVRSEEKRVLPFAGLPGRNGGD